MTTIESRPASEPMTGQFEPACVGAMGLAEPGSPCCAAPPTPTDAPSWGELKAIYR